MLVLCFIFEDIFRYCELSKFFVCNSQLNQYLIDNYGDDVYEQFMKHNWSVSLNLV